MGSNFELFVSDLKRESNQVFLLRKGRFNIYAMHQIVKSKNQIFDYTRRIVSKRVTNR